MRMLLNLALFLGVGAGAFAVFASIPYALLAGLIVSGACDALAFGRGNRD